MTFLSDLIYSQLFITLPYPTVPLTGKTIIITGANTGLGFEAAKHCVRLGAGNVILAVRDVSKGIQAQIAIESAYPARDTVIDIWDLDLLSVASIKAFATKAKGLNRLDALLENAGMVTMAWRTFEGFESTIMTNVIGTELLAMLLLPKLQDTARKFNVQPRLSIVTSESHMVSLFAERKEENIFSALNRESGANMDDRYSVSKLLQIFFVRELAIRISHSAGPKVIVNCMSPGACHSQIHRNLTGFKKISMSILKMLIARTAEEGSRTLIAALIAGPESHGEYMADCAIARPSEFVTSEEGAILQRRLWVQTIEKLESIEPGITNVLLR